MSSMFTSDEILSLEKVNLVFRLRYFEDRTFRDQFVKMLKHPVEFALKPKESLHILKDISFRVRRGDKLAIIGLNGSGKTTLCRCIAGIFRPDSGKISVYGKVQAIFSNHVGVLPELTGRENAKLLARLLFPDETEPLLDNMVEDALNFSELNEFLDVPYETYSQGMKARLCLSVATAKSSDLLIMDEVYDNADQFFQIKMTARLKEFVEQAGATIFVSHSPDYIRMNCNRAIVLQNSRIVYDGSVDMGLKAYEFLNGAPIESLKREKRLERENHL